MSESYVTYIGASPANIILVLGWAGGRPVRWHKLSSGGFSERFCRGTNWMRACCWECLNDGIPADNNTCQEILKGIFMHVLKICWFFFFANLRSKFESLDVRAENTERVRNTAPANETWFYVCFTYLPNPRKWDRFSSHLQKPVGRTSTPLSYQKNEPPPLWKLYNINFTKIKNCTPVQCMFRTLPLTPWTYSLVRLREWSKNTKTRKRDNTKTRKRAKQERTFCRKQQKKHCSQSN